jgi:single-strand DNA-binding protein
MDASNLVVARGTVTSAPRRRDLPSGSYVTELDVTTHSDHLSASMPVVLHDRDVAVAEGHEVVVVGSVQRRFFRAGGQTQSRTEVVASSVVKATRTRTVERLLNDAIALLAN